MKKWIGKSKKCSKVVGKDTDISLFLSARIPTFAQNEVKKTWNG